MANVVDLGTRFVLSVTQSSATKVQVVEGEADVFTKTLESDLDGAENEVIKLRERQARLIDSEDRMTVREIPFKASEYTATLPDRVTKFEATEDDRGAVDELLSVSIQRNSVEHMHTVDPFLDSPNTPESIGTRGFGLRFQTPVLNGLGLEVVFFELQTIVNSERGDAFHVSPLYFEKGLHSYNSDLGYPIGAKVEGLFFQDAADDSDFFDPLFIVGLPPTP